MFRIRIEQDDRILVDEACEAAVVVLAKKQPFIASQGFCSIVHQCHSFDKRANEMVVATVQEFLTKVPTHYDYETGEMEGDENDEH